jgi:glutamate transport system substrate-binding protein
MHMKRWTWAVALLTVLSLGAAACGSDSGGKSASGDGASSSTTSTTFPVGSTMARIAEAKKMTVGTKFDQPLFGLKDPRTGDVQGFDVEIAKLIANAIGKDVKIEFKETPSAIRETAIQDGTVDMVVATYTINDTRKQKIDFAGPYYVAGQDIMVAKDNTTIKRVEDLNGKKVCSVQGSTSLSNVRLRAPQAQLTEYDVYSKCADDLRNGRVDAVSTDNVILVGLVDKSGGAFKLVGATFTDEPYGIGLKKGDTAFRTFVNDTLEKLYKNGDWLKAYKDTVGKVDGKSPTPPAVNRY